MRSGSASDPARLPARHHGQSRAGPSGHRPPWLHSPWQRKQRWAWTRAPPFRPAPCPSRRRAAVVSDIAVPTRRTVKAA
jgi:hypothetical protein